MYFIHAFSRTTLGGTLLLASRLCFCFSYLVPSTLFLTCSVSLAYMYTLHVCQLRWRVQRTRLCILLPLPYTLPYCTCTLHLVLRVTMHLLHTIHYTTALYLYSVLLGRASSAVVLQRLPNIRCLSCLLCTCSTSSRTGIREWISDELRSHRGHREQHLCSVFV